MYSTGTHCTPVQKYHIVLIRPRCAGGIYVRLDCEAKIGLWSVRTLSDWERWMKKTRKDK